MSGGSDVQLNILLLILHCFPFISVAFYLYRKSQMLANKSYHVRIDFQNDCGTCTDIRVHILEVKTQTELLDFTLRFLSGQRKKEEADEANRKF